MPDRVPYLDLTPAQREEIHAWLNEHGVDHRRVPVHGHLDRGPAGEWVVPVFVRGADGRVRLHPVTREPMQDSVRFRERRPLPWPTIGGGQ